MNTYISLSKNKLYLGKESNPSHILSPFVINYEQGTRRIIDINTLNKGNVVFNKLKKHKVKHACFVGESMSEQEFIEMAQTKCIPEKFTKIPGI